MEKILKLNTVVLALTTILFLVCARVNVYAANQVTSPQIKKQEYNLSDKAGQLEKIKKQSPGYYYYLMALHQLANDKNQNRFNSAINLLNKSIKNNFQLSHFALAVLYYDKYTSGKLTYGIKGQPKDLLLAIKNYKIAAKFGSPSAQNNLGEIYLDSANLNGKNRYDDNRAKDVKDYNATIKLPDVDKAVYWLTTAAMNGNPAAQITLSDLYRQGIGIKQDYVLAYFWQALGVASQTLFNPRSINNYIGQRLSEVQRKTLYSLYDKLNKQQKDEAYNLIKTYAAKYVIKPSSFDQTCQNTQTFIAVAGITKLMENYQTAQQKKSN